MNCYFLPRVIYITQFTSIVGRILHRHEPIIDESELVSLSETCQMIIYSTI